MENLRNVSVNIFSSKRNQFSLQAAVVATWEEVKPVENLKIEKMLEEILDFMVNTKE